MVRWVKTQSTQDYRKTNNFSGGFNNGNPANAIGDNQISEGYGWDTETSSSLIVRKGRSKYGSVGGGVTRLIANFGNNSLVRAVGVKLQYDNAGTWTDITGTFSDIDWDSTNFEVAAAPALIITNGTDAVSYWNGTALTALSVDAPKGKYITNDTIRVWIAKGDVIYYCGYLAPTDWTSAENSGSVQYYTNNGGDITGILNFYGNKYVWKKDSFAVIQGTNYFNFKLREISNQIGCISFKTIKEASNALFWLDYQDVWMFNGGFPISIGTRIRDYIKDINPAYIDRCFGATDGVRYYLGLVTGNSVEPNTLLIYDPRKEYQKWQATSIDGAFRYGALLNNVMYVGDSLGQTYKFNTGTADGVTPITWQAISKAFDEGVPEAEKEYFELHVQGYFAAGSNMYVYVSTTERGEDFTVLGIYTFTENTTQNENVIVPLDTVNITNWFRYKLEGSGPAEISSVQRQFRVLPVQI